jgi:hypothetical protein
MRLKGQGCLSWHFLWKLSEAQGNSLDKNPFRLTILRILLM